MSMESPPPATDDLPGLRSGIDGLVRCWWAGEAGEYTAYHDLEWGVPVRDDRALFEKICLEGFQSGLSWLTILRKREAFRAAFADFEFEAVARYTSSDVERLLGNAGIIRHRGKIEATINNAHRACEMASEFGSLSAYFWQWEPTADTRPSTMDYETVRTLVSTPESVGMAKDLKLRGWRFVGPTTAYAFMQAMGLVNDHIEGCHARPRIEALRAKFERPTTKSTP